MQRKFASYLFLSFVSFGIATTLFHTVANAETSPLIPAPSNIPSISPLPPTPTLQPTQPSTVKFTLQSIDAPTPTPETKKIEPTPTIFQAQPTKAAEPNAVPLPTAIPVSEPAPTDTPLPKPTIPVAADLDIFFAKYASEYNVDKEDLIRIAKCEAGFNSQADTGLYAGMFQFASQTWISNRTAMGLDPNPDLRKNAEESIRTAAFMINRGNRGAWPNC